MSEAKGDPQTKKIVGLSGLIAAAVVNTEFRTRLLADPRAALAGGYNGQEFSLTPEEAEYFGTIHETDIRAFAKRVSEFTPKNMQPPKP